MHLEGGCCCFLPLFFFIIIIFFFFFFLLLWLSSFSLFWPSRTTCVRFRFIFVLFSENDRVFFLLFQWKLGAPKRAPPPERGRQNGRHGDQPIALFHGDPTIELFGAVGALVAAKMQTTAVDTKQIEKKRTKHDRTAHALRRPGSKFNNNNKKNKKFITGQALRTRQQYRFRK